jgi:hypothetical protein
MIDVEFDAQAVQDALLGQADALRGALEARIQQKLSGEVLQTRSGALAAEPILMSSAAETTGNVAAALAIVAIALGRDHADAAASLGDIEATAPEIGAAMATVLRLGGFIETPAQGDAALGEAQAGEVRAMDPPASISASSTQDS